jgi:CCR4-NOT transcription complex subunit 7/8
VSLAANAAELTPVRPRAPRSRAFSGAYDFAYMVKMLTETWHEFMAQAKALLSSRVFDDKYMAGAL